MRVFLRASLSLWVCQIVVANLSVRADDSAPRAADAPVEHTAFKPVMPEEKSTPFADQDNPKPVKVRIYPMYTKLPRSGKCPVIVELKIDKGWHVNANPSSPDYLVPTRVELKCKQKVKLVRVKYPDFHKLQVKGSPDPYHVYDGTVSILTLLEVTEESSVDGAELFFHVNYQGCNGDQCYPPDKIMMKGRLKVAAAGEALVPIKANASRFEAFKTPRTAKQSDGDAPAKP